MAITEKAILPMVGAGTGFMWDSGYISINFANIKSPHILSGFIDKEISSAHLPFLNFGKIIELGLGILFIGLVVRHEYFNKGGQSAHAH